MPAKPMFSRHVCAYTIIIFIVVGLLMIWGIFAGDTPAGWANWTVGDAPFAGGWHTLFMTSMVVGFSFQGTGRQTLKT